MSRNGRVGAARQLLGSLLAALATIVLAEPSMARDGKQLRIAVAANFTEPVMKIGAAFERTSRHKLAVAFGATGQLYAQISQGAPFEILLAADKATPAKAIAEGHAVAGTAFTYALGRLVLFSRTGDLIQGEATLRNAGFAKIAIANPATAPYGAAAIETMKALGVYDALQPRIVQGNSIAQVFQFVDTGNAEAGFVALSQIALVEGGSRWIVPARLHAPIAQDGVLLAAGAESEAAKAFLAYLKGAEARAVIQKFGYEVGE